MRYFIDWLGRLWHGPVAHGDNLHYAQFCGYMIVPPFNPIWSLCRSSPPEDADEVPYDTALKAALLFWNLPGVPADIEDY